MTGVLLTSCGGGHLQHCISSAREVCLLFSIFQSFTSLVPLMSLFCISGYRIQIALFDVFFMIATAVKCQKPVTFSFWVAPSVSHSTLVRELLPHF